MDYSRHNLRTSHQHKTIPSHTCTAGFKVSTMKLWAVKKWNSLKQITFFPSIKSTGETFKNFVNKNIAYLLLFVVLSNHSIYVVFWDPHQALMTLPSFCLLLKAYVELR